MGDSVIELGVGCVLAHLFVGPHLNFVDRFLQPKFIDYEFIRRCGNPVYHISHKAFMTPHTSTSSNGNGDIQTYPKPDQHWEKETEPDLAKSVTVTKSSLVSQPMPCLGLIAVSQHSRHRALDSSRMNMINFCSSYEY